MIGKIALALAATTMAAAPLAANPASSLSVAKQVRASTQTRNANGALGGAGAAGLLLGAGIVAILVVGLTVGDDGSPDSN
ncbi:hypothetical protein [Sphingomonas sp. Y38-1Y]|jgi:hypothetical protein|uniref:hypothetical protein n=1 Tax=Sphingomonas sp. Y38-1Y TaxID=3078265 RepID=UPI0028EFF25A|nr:hypothetical protein [Sphingomonas sp. Y38-1Y]